MGERSTTPVPKLLRIMEELGENIKLARLRRKLTTGQVCERAGIGLTTLWAGACRMRTWSLEKEVRRKNKAMDILSSADILGKADYS